MSSCRSDEVKMKKIGRNQPCPCGSGKKYKYCCIDKIPRNQYNYIGYREKFGSICFENEDPHVILSNGKKEKPDAVFSQIQYTRKKGTEKIVNSIPEFAIDIVSHLASNYNFIYAIDTNTKQIGNNKISVCSIIEAYFSRIDCLRYRKNGNIIFKKCPDGLEEKFSWIELIKVILSNKNYNDEFKIAIITDHDHGNHTKYNKKELALVEDFYLPDNFTLFYASSDTGKEFLLNKLISECEKDAKKVLNEFEKNDIIYLDDTEISIDNISEPNFDNL